jgi:hypothetical protein
MYTSRIFLIQDSVIQNLNSFTNGLIRGYGLSLPTYYIFKNVSFLNLKPSTTATNTLLWIGPPQYIQFFNCSFVHTSSDTPLIEMPYFMTFYQVTSFENCTFSSPVRMYSPLFSFIQSTWPTGLISLKDCLFKDFVLNSPSGMIFVMTASAFNMSHCQFQNISNSALSLVFVSYAKPFVMGKCEFYNISGTSLLVSYSSELHLISECTFSKTNTSLQGLLRFVSARNVSILDSSFSEVRGSIDLIGGSSVLSKNCSFWGYFSSPMFNLLTGANLTALNVTFDGSMGSYRCITSSQNVLINLSN